MASVACVVVVRGHVRSRHNHERGCSVRAAHPLIGKIVRWSHGPNVLVGPATHFDDEDEELFIVPDGLLHGHYWVPARECVEVYQ